MGMALSNTQRSEDFGMLQDIVDALFGPAPQGADGEPCAMSAHEAREAEPRVRRLDVVLAAETAGAPDDLLEVVSLLPPGTFTRQMLCDQLNSALGAHAWGRVYGTVS